MEESGKPYKKEFRPITIKTSEGSTIQGKVNLGVKERVSELFTKSDQAFIVLVDATTKEGTGKVLFVNKNHIVWVEPED